MAELGPGSELDGCRIIEQLGRGGMGVVYRARQLELDRDVAVKVISPDRIADDEARTRFLKEARAAVAVEHANVLPIYAVGIAGDHPYIVMRYVSGDDLRMLVRLHGALPPPETARIVLALGGALDAIHRAGFVHRDVKPANVLIDRDGHVYLSDFGLAKHALSSTGLTRSDRWVGSLDFAAPEQIRGGKVDARADVYSLGGVLHYMLTATVPYDRPTEEAKLWAHLADVPPRPSELRRDLPPAFDAIVARAMAKDPDDRFPSAGDLGSAVRAASGGVAAGPERAVATGAAAGTASLDGTITRARRRPRRGRMAIIATAALVALATAGAALLLTGRDPERSGNAADAGARPTPTTTAGPEATPEPEGPHVGRTIRGLGTSPRDVAVARGDVWVISAHRSRVTRLRAATMRRHGLQPSIGRGATSISSDGDTVWVAIPRRLAIVALDARTGRQRGVVSITDAIPRFVAAGGGSLWIAAERLGPIPDLLLRYSTDGVRLGFAQIRGDIDALTASAQQAWVSQDTSSLLIGFDAALHRTARRYLITRSKRMAFGGGRVWLSEQEGDALGRFDPDRRRLAQPRVGPRPAGVAYADGRVFIVSNTASRLYVIDPRTLKKTAPPLKLPLNPWAVQAGAGHVWITGMASGTLTRIDY